MVIAADCSTTAAAGPSSTTRQATSPVAARPAHAAAPPSIVRQDAEQWWGGHTWRHCCAVAALCDPEAGSARCVHHAPARVVRMPSRRQRAASATGDALPGRLSARGDRRARPDASSRAVRQAAGHHPRHLQAGLACPTRARWNLRRRLRGRRTGVPGLAADRPVGDQPRLGRHLRLFDSSSAWSGPPSCSRLPGIRGDQLPDLVPAGDELGICPVWEVRRARWDRRGRCPWSPA